VNPWHPAELHITRNDVKLCCSCEDKHFRAYPESPGDACYRPQCQCWCNDRQETERIERDD